MSVRKWERKPSLMEVQLKAIDLLAYTIQQAANERVVPKRHRWSVGTRLIDCALDAALHIDIANTLDLFDASQAAGVIAGMLPFLERTRHARTYTQESHEA